MIYHDREVGFLRTVGAVNEISKICPKQNISKLGDVIHSESTVTRNEAWFTFICALSRGYEMSKHFFDKSYKPNPITKEELEISEDGEVTLLISEATLAWVGDARTVEAEEPKKKEETSETSD